MAVELNVGCFGSPDNPSLVILHGLLGSSRNWMSVGQALAGHFNVFTLDLRNHGESPHTDTMTYEYMVGDLTYWLERKKVGNFYLLGHSLGGKVAMAYACRYPECVMGLIVEDIVPKEYAHRYASEFEAMNALDLSSIKMCSDADKAMEEKIPDWNMRQFVLTNLVRRPDRGGFCWQINLPVLTKSMPEILKSPLGPDDEFCGPTLFIRGEDSDYIEEDDRELIKRHFPCGELLTIPQAGHNVHIEKKQAFIEAVLAFEKQTPAGKEA